MNIVFEYGRVWSMDELPNRSIALDGAVRGPIIDVDRERYSFDHHDGCVRHATLSCCEQVYDAIRVGLEPTNYSCFVNDVDADSTLGAWLLLNPDRIRNDPNDRVSKLVREIGRVDALGPVAGRAGPLMTLLEPAVGEVQTIKTLERSLELLDSWWRGDELPEPPTTESVPALWCDERASAPPTLVHGEVLGGFRGLYAKALYGVLIVPAPEGTTSYSVGKASEFVRFDVRRFLDRCNELEPGWGGGTSIGGSPRNPDGTRSRLTVDQVGEVLLEVATR